MSCIGICCCLWLPLLFLLQRLLLLLLLSLFLLLLHPQRDGVWHLNLVDCLRMRTCADFYHFALCCSMDFNGVSIRIGWPIGIVFVCVWYLCLFVWATCISSCIFHHLGSKAYLICVMYFQSAGEICNSESESKTLSNTNVKSNRNFYLNKR